MAATNGLDSLTKAELKALIVSGMVSQGTETATKEKPGFVGIIVDEKYGTMLEFRLPGQDRTQRLGARKVLGVVRAMREAPDGTVEKFEEAIGI